MQYSSPMRLPRLIYKQRARLSRLIGVGFASLGLVAAASENIVGARVDIWPFILTILPAMLLEVYFIYAPYLRNPFLDLRGAASEVPSKRLYYKIIGLLYVQRRRIRFIMLLAVAIACAMIVVQLLQGGVSTESRAQISAGIVAIMFYFFGITIVARVQHVAIRSFRNGSNWALWLFASVLAGSVLGYGLFFDWNPSTLLLVFAGIALGTGISWVVFVDNRLGVADRVWSEVVQDLSMNLMAMETVRRRGSYAINLIGERLRFERVFLLEPSTDKRMLRVTAECGDYPSVVGSEYPAEQGITGHVFSSGQASAWNNVRDCPYYHRLAPEEKDTTRSEIAVPIQHRGELYGVLDIQSKHTNVYGAADIKSLETIANIVGMSMAVDNADILLTEASSLWSQLSDAELTEAEALRLIADFGRNKLGADLVIYYPLSPTGYPFKSPYVLGELVEPDQMANSVLDPSSPLIKLIAEWNPCFESDLKPESVFLGGRSSKSPSFAKRERIRSVSFIPIGTKSERLGIVFLNHRHRHEFDSIYRLMVMAFAQAFATLASRARYRQIVFEGFGRPELGVHNIQAKYGLKEGVLREGRRIFSTSCRTLIQSKGEFTECDMFKILENVDDFLSEIRAQTTVEFGIWNRTLREAFQDYTRRMKEQSLNRHIWFITDLDQQVERESPWTRLALYRVLTEAVNNAVFHARAMEVNILVERREKTIFVRVVNDGNPFPTEAAWRNRSRGGIFTLLDELKNQFGANFSIRSGEKKGGAIVEAEIPALPIQVAEVSLV